MSEMQVFGGKSACSKDDDPLVEIPGLTGSEFLRKSQISGMDIKSLVVRCTVCRSQINHLDHHKVKKHRKLNVIVCRECFDFYGNEEFSKDENGNYNYCTWCGNGGKLYLCDFCPNVFCMNCVKRNFGRAEVAEMLREGWKCYICDPNKVKAKVAYCDMIIEYSKKKTTKDKKSELETPKELISELWVLEAFTKTEQACRSLLTKMDKLKHVEVSRSKSLKHIIKKMEEVVSKHKSELGNITKTLSSQYIAYVKLKQAEEKQTSNGYIENSVNEDPKKPAVISIISDSEESLKKQKIHVEENFLQSDSSKIAPKSKMEINGDNELKIPNSIDLQSKNVSSQDDMDVDNSGDLLETKCSKSDIENDIEMKAKMELLRDSSDESDEKPKFSGSAKFEREIIKSCPASQKCNITVTAEVHSSELQNEDPDCIKGKGKPKTYPKIVNKTLNKSKNCAIKESSVSSLNSDSCSSLSGIDLESPGSSKKHNIPRKKNPQKTTKSKNEEIDYVNDEKLRLPTSVILERCDDMMDGQTTIKVPAIFLLDELDKAIKNLIKEPENKAKAQKNIPSENDSTEIKKASKKVPKKKISHQDSSSSIIFSSEEDEHKPIDKKDNPVVKEDLEAQAKKELLDSGDTSSVTDLSGSDVDDAIQKKKSKKNTGNKNNSDSSEDFQPRKKKKFDKLLSKRLFSDNESGKENKKSSSDRQKKRKHLSSDDDFQSSKIKSSESSSTSSTSETDEERKPKSKRRKRIKKRATSSSEQEDDKKEKGETPKKGRKDIKKIISKKDLKVETKEAQQAERERRKRIEEKQKLYNVITDTSKDGKEVITKKLVLEVDPVSKEELVQIYPELIEKLKPHQVNGVKFMWECTIESLKDLETGSGSGCIVAHCMGLGKTLQVVTFLHTCLTNEIVNKKIKNAMVICPYNTVLNWSKEFDLWLSPLDTESITIHEMAIAKDNYMRLDILKYWHKEGGVLIISYDIFRRLAAEKIPKLSRSMREKVHFCLLDPGPDIVICDEGHILKNETSAISKACSQLKTQRRVVLTGTPLQNNLKEYHCMLSFVKPHLLGTSKEFRNRFANPIMNGQYEDSNEYDVRRMKKRIHILHKLLEGCVQRCDYSALTKFLPDKHEYVLSIKLSDVQIKMYQWYLDNKSKAKGQDKIQGSALFQDYNILRNLCTHPYIVHTSFERQVKRKINKNDDTDLDEYDDNDSFINDSSSSAKSSGGSDTDEIIKEYKTRSRKKLDADDKEDSVEEVEVKQKEWYHEFISDDDAHKIELSGKMVILFNILKECESIGDKVIVFSQSLLTLNIIEDMLKHMDSEELGTDCNITDSFHSSWVKGLDYFRMDGSTSADFRKQFIDMFNNPAYDRARLFLVSTRAGGLGTNLVGANRVVILDASWNPSHDVQAIFRVYRFGQKKPVYIYRLLAQGTMEEKIYDRQVTKLSLSIRVVDEQQIERHFNAAELSELYTFDPESQSNRPTPMVPSDRLLAEMLMKHKDLIVNYHEHDSLLQKETEADLTEEERKAAWNEYENEREGRSTTEIALEEEVSKYCKEPDFNEADYDSPVIPDAKFIIEGLITSLREQYPEASHSELRQKLAAHIYYIRSVFQEKHVKTLRMKQEFVARGSVPSVVNKYLEELNSIINQLAIHYTTVKQLVVQDNQKLAQEYASKMQAQRSAMQNQGHPVHHTSSQNMPGYAPRPHVRYATQVPNMNNFKQYNNVQFRNTRPAFVPSVPRAAFSAPNFNPSLNNQARFARASTTSQPVVTEAPAEEQVFSDMPENSNATSTVVIEEIE